MAGSTFQTNPCDFDKLLEECHLGTIQLPDFQRSWVWDKERIKSLIVLFSRGCSKTRKSSETLCRRAFEAQRGGGLPSRFHSVHSLCADISVTDIGSKVPVGRSSKSSSAESEYQTAARDEVRNCYEPDRHC